MKSPFFLFILLTLNLTLFAQGQRVISSTADFKIKNAGITVDGSFTPVNATIQWNEKNPSTSKISGEVMAQSVKTGIALRDRHLREKSEFFNAPKFPKLSMESVRIEPDATGNFQATWDLSIKGLTLRFKSVLHREIKGTQTRLWTDFKIDRRQWKVGGNSLTMGDIVSVHLEALLANDTNGMNR